MKRSLCKAVFVIFLLSVFVAPGETLAAGTWTSIGPWGGNVRGVAVDPFDSNTVYAVTYGCGVYKSTDAGATWSQSGLHGTFLTAIAVDANASGTVYVGAYSNSGGKVYKSTDGGAHWSNSSSGLSTTGEETITAIVAPADTPGVLYAGNSENGVYKSTNSGTNWSPARTGLASWNIEALAANPAVANTIYAGTTNGQAFKSTDGGANWGILANSPSAVYSLAVDPAVTNTVYAGTNSGVQKSTDGGASWSPTNFVSTGANALVVAPDAPATVYAGTAWGLYLSTDGGANWSGPFAGAEWVSALALDPSASDTVYTGSLSGPAYKTTDGGATWNTASQGLSCWDFEALALDTLTSSFYAGDFGAGVMKTSDGGATWNKVNKDLTTTIQALTVDPSNSHLYAGTFNGLFKSTDEGANWSAINSGLSGLNTSVVAVDPGDSNIVFAVANGGLHKSTDAGASWVGKGGGLGTVSSLAFSPGVANTVFASSYTNGVLRSIDNGDAWTEMNTGLTTLNIDTVAISNSNADIMYAGAWNGEAFRSTDGGSTWTEASAGMDSPYLYDLLVHPADPSTLYAGTNDGVFKSTDGGDSWTPMNVGLVYSNIKALVMDPAAPHIIYAAGLHSSVQKLELTSDIRVPFSLDFGQVEVLQSVTKTLTVANDGVATLSVSDMQLTGADKSQYSLDAAGGTCVTAAPTILAGESCTVNVTFSPTYGGTISASLSITSDDPQKPAVAVELNGTGDVPLVPDIAVYPPSLDFGDVTEYTDSSPLEVWIYNYGTADLYVSSLQLAGTNPDEFSVDEYGGYDACANYFPYLSPGYYCTASVTFSPVDQGSKSAALEISSDDPDSSLISVLLNGTGVSAAINNAPSAPELVSPADGAVITGSTVTFGWNGSTDADGDTVTYELYVCGDPIFSGIGCDVPAYTVTASLGGASYAGAGIGVLFISMAFAGGIGRRRKAALFLALILVAGMLIVSCGGGGSDTPPPVTPEYTHDLSGFAVGPTYWWKVVATDGMDATDSETRSFTMQ